MHSLFGLKSSSSRAEQPVPDMQSTLLKIVTRYASQHLLLIIHGYVLYLSA